MEKPSTDPSADADTSFTEQANRGDSNGNEVRGKPRILPPLQEPSLTHFSKHVGSKAPKPSDLPPLRKPISKDQTSQEDATRALPAVENNCTVQIQTKKEDNLLSKTLGSLESSEKKVLQKMKANRITFEPEPSQAKAYKDTRLSGNEETKLHQTRQTRKNVEVKSVPKTTGYLDSLETKVLQKVKADKNASGPECRKAPPFIESPPEAARLTQAKNVAQPGAFSVDGMDSSLATSRYDDLEQQRSGCGTEGTADTTISATLVNETPAAVASADLLEERKYSTGCVLLAVLAVAATSAAVVAPVLLTHRTPSKTDSSALGPPSGAPSLSTVSTQAPTIFSGPRRPFESSDELRSAVDAYLEDGSPLSEVSLTYGYPIGQWDVSRITDFSAIFSFRNALLGLFNEELSGWDVSRAVTMENMFDGASSFNQPIGNWNTSAVSNMKAVLRGASSFNQPLADWDVSRVTDISFAFNDASRFNQPIEGWDVSSVVTMDALFWRAASFNQPLNQWNVSSVQYLGGTFWQAYAFNQPLDKWDVSKAEYLDGTLSRATSFNQPLNMWNVSRAKDMSNMFHGTTKFNQPLNDWDVSKVERMFAMFARMDSFNQPLDKWKLSSVQDAGRMFQESYSLNQDLSPWDVSSLKMMDFMFLNASAFNQDLCEWGQLIHAETNTSEAFTHTDCPNSGSPVLGGVNATGNPGPFCHVC